MEFEKKVQRAADVEAKFALPAGSLAYIAEPWLADWYEETLNGSVPGLMYPASGRWNLCEGWSYDPI